MPISDRQQQFREAIRALPETLADARIAENFGFSNSARIIEGGLFACTNNLETYSKNLAAASSPAARQFVFLCVLSFPPQDEVYFAVTIRTEADRVNAGLLKLFHEGEHRNAELTAAGRKPGSISNNVKFYITATGQIFFHNYDFQESLNRGASDPPLDPDCLAKIDAIHFAIYPPTVSARRSLLAREFVGYLASLTGRDKVHELRVWTATLTLKPEMQRMPATIPIADIEASIKAAGGHYPGGEIARLHAGLNFHDRKHFVILTGLSGSGKTQIARQYARAVHGVGETGAADPLLFVCPVRPEWTDPTGLTGYYDVLSNRYVVPPFLEAVLVALAHQASPIFVVLDELNLARVEHYLADVLSCMETGESLQLHSNSVPIEGSNGTPIPAELPLPKNLYLIGTINVDETTNPVSDKVLDRAIVLDMSKLDMAGYLTALGNQDAKLKASCDACKTMLLAAQDVMSLNNLGFGYRVAEEVVRYYAFTVGSMAATPAATIDDLMVQKVLVKLRGTERQRAMLNALAKQMEGFPRCTAYLGRLLGDLDEFGTFQANR